MISSEENKQRVVKFVQELLLDEADKSAITTDLISRKMELVLTMSPSWRKDLDRDAVSDELIRRFSLWIGKDATLTNDTGHQPWLLSARKKDWRYWQRYREWLEKQISWKAVDALDRSTDAVLGLLEDPVRDGSWDRRGLVVGHVQSGKTSNYTGLICKAADAGYKIVIVLAGLHNNLRAQTQMRLDEGFLGYETQPLPEDIRITGVGEVDGDPAIRPNYATNRSEKGDFNTAIAKHLGITPEQRPWLFVVKKNKTVLERLYQWIRNHVANVHDPLTGSRVVTHLPLLLIDDEADHASVDTGEQVFDADGKPDEEHEPTAINSRIRRILNSFTRKAYVGYTATPFANIFIHERGTTREEGPDLFPSAFIINLAAPSNYIGPARVFGVRGPNGRQGGLPLVREVRDFASNDGRSGWMPVKHRNGYMPMHEGRDEIPPSLVEAIDAFILACAARAKRGQSSQHCSMLVHVTRFNSIQKEVTRQIDEHVKHMRQRLTRRIDDGEIVARLRNLWLTDFGPASRQVRESVNDATLRELPSWEDILADLPTVMADLEVRMINGTAKDALDYADRTGAGLKVIAVGGDKLARGLTLEGLCTSYFLRASKMYDTLMQMGRWFGYRPGYLDVCRLYTTSDLIEWFGHIADASEELREEFDLMAASGATPRQYGLKVRSHSVLMVTSRLKMRTAKNLLLSFSGQLLETVSLYRRLEVLQANLAVTKRLVGRMRTPKEDRVVVRVRNGARQEWKGYLWEAVPAESIVEFFTGYQTHPEAYKVNSNMLAEFTQSMANSGELTSWTVALIGGGDGSACSLADGVSVDMLKRKFEGPHEDRYSIGRLLSPRDEAIDLDEPSWQAALALTKTLWRSDPGRMQETKEPDAPSGPAIRKVRGFGADGVAAHPERGLLLLYALDPRPEWTNLPEGAPPVIAFGASFPGSDSGQRVEYKVNNLLWEQEYGPTE